MAEPACRATSSARTSSSTLVALATSLGGISTSFGRGAEVGSSATTVAPDPLPRAAAAAVSAAAISPASDRSEVWAKPVDSPTTTRMPAPRSRPEVSSSTRPSSSRADDDRFSSTNTSAKSAPRARPALNTRWTVDSSSKGDSSSKAGSSRGVGVVANTLANTPGPDRTPAEIVAP